MADSSELGVALLGYGTVGQGVALLLEREADDITARMGAALTLRGIAVRDIAAPRERPAPEGLLTTDADALVIRDDVDIVVEVMGGIDRADELIRAALSAGKSVVTANKELVAAHGPELAALARENRADLLYEAAVAGAIPIIRPLRESLAGDRVRRVVGILNGTTNYILSRMTSEGADFDDVLADAQKLGFAEADPTADVGGHDAASKTAILASLAFDATVRGDEVFREGIESVTARDIELAARLGYVIKLLGIATDFGDSIGVRVHPTFVPKGHQLASIDGSFNAVWVDAEAAGQLLFSGRGAGSLPTGSAVVGDVIDAARNRLNTSRAADASGHRKLRVESIEDLTTQYFLRLLVDDKPGVLAAIAAVFGGNKVSIAQVLQEDQGERAELVLVTHAAKEADLRRTVVGLERAESVLEIASVIRVESESLS